MAVNLTLADIFTDNMVLQRDTQIKIWGSTVEDSAVLVEFCGQSRKTFAKGGKWSVRLFPLTAGGPYTMRISDGENEISRKNILVGDVWIAGGQSNMEHPLIVTREGKDEIPAATYKSIRYYNVPRRPFEGAVIDGWHFLHTVSTQSEWVECTPENAGYFSAVAYHFAKNIHLALDVPIGIVGCNWGATSAACWIREEYLSEDEELKIYIDDYNEYTSKFNMQEYEKEFNGYLVRAKEVIEEMENIPIDPDNVDEYLLDNSAGPMPQPPLGPKSYLRPAGLYYAMLKKIIPYSVKGVIWYQGESDAGRPYLYRKLFSKMIQNWRDDWDNPELPFIFVQLASFDSQWLKPGIWADLRESQLYVSKNVKNTAMAVSIDHGDKINIHPSEKGPVGERLALLALNRVYGQDKACSGPEYTSMKVTGNKIILYFDCIGDGLNSGGEPLKGFEVCGEDGNFFGTAAKIEENTVEVLSDKVDLPVAVRYGWANYTEANLYNNFGLPASPFRTDI